MTEPGQPPVIPPVAKADKRFGELVLNTMSEVNPHHDPMQELVARTVAEEVEKIKTTQEKEGDLVEILEIGTGDGVSAKQILEANPDIRIVGTDNDTKLTASAREKLTGFVENGRLEVQDKDALEFLKQFPDDSIELISSTFTIHNFKSDYRQEVLKEIFRVLKPGGAFVTGDKIIPDDEAFFQQEFSEQMARFKAFRDPSQSENWIKHYHDDCQSDVIMRERELVEILTEIGFSDISITNRKGLQALLRAEK